MNALNTLPGFRLVMPDEGQFEHLDESFGPTLRFTQSMLYRSRGMLPAENPTLEAVGACHLWWRAVLLFHDALELWNGDASLAMHFIARAAAEGLLHTSLIMQPLQAGARLGSSPFDELLRTHSADVVCHRLRGYLSWVTHGEIAALQDLLRASSLKMVFEPETGRAFAKRLAELDTTYPWIREVFTEPETLTDAEAEREKREFAVQVEAELKRTKALYAHPGLADWGERTRDGAGRGLTLSAILDGPERGASSIRKTWAAVGLDIGRLTYDKASALLHGSRLAPAAHLVREQVIAPSPELNDVVRAQEHMSTTLQVLAVHVHTLVTIVMDRTDT